MRSRKRKQKFGKKLLISSICISVCYYIAEETTLLFPNDKAVVEGVVEGPDPQANAVDQQNNDFIETVIESDSALIDLSAVNSSGVVLTRLNDETVIAAKNPDQVLYPASLTKIMTVITAIDLIDDLNEDVVMEEVFFDGLFEQEAAITGFLVDEVVTYNDLLYGAILPSGADACLALAYKLAGSEEKFVALMNQKAGELGLSHTRFSNVTGLHDKNNYSSAKDLSVLLEYALENDDFYRVFTTIDYQVEPTNMNPYGIYLVNSVFRHGEQYPKMLDYIIGAKTGFTEEAGVCLASLAIINDEPYILITLGAGAQKAGPDYVDIVDPLHVMDAIAIYSQLEK